MVKPTLSARNLNHSRGATFRLAIDQLDFLPGKIYCLLGPNGSGKSTLLHLLALLEPPAGGEIFVGGDPVKGAAVRNRLRQRITLVEQAPFLFDATVYHNLAFGLRLRDVRGDLQRRRIAKALAAVGLAGFETRRARELSGGEIQRVALARAMVLTPKVLLLDEPSEGLDRQSLPMFEDCLRELAREGATVVIATHDTDQPERLGAEDLRIEAGRLISPSLPAKKRMENA